MEDIKQKSNSELTITLKELEFKFNKIKQILIEDYDMLVQIEKQYNEIKTELDNRFNLKN